VDAPLYPTARPDTLRRAEALAEAALPRIVAATEGAEFATFLAACRLRSKDGWGEEDPEVEEFRGQARRALRDRLTALWPARRVVAFGAEVTVTLTPGASQGAL